MWLKMCASFSAHHALISLLHGAHQLGMMCVHTHACVCMCATAAAAAATMVTGGGPGQAAPDVELAKGTL